ncbi:FecR family protein [Carboxylicivirga taeanensis]|uniref:FecR family protein n=1 Tax=Carboxylicivirga taeanensis TaxID=1416875 RepID=UPI003F6E294D
MQHKGYDISEIIAKYLFKELTSAEEECLNDWRQTPSNNELFHYLIDKDRLSTQMQVYEQSNRKRTWEKVESAIGRRMRLRKLVSYAAAIVMPFIVFGLIYILQRNVESARLAHSEQVVQPGTFGATLHLHGGEVLHLSDDTTQQIKLNEELLLSQKNNQVSFINREVNIGQSQLNKIITGRGHEYQLILPDGTYVYLNACSQIEFPTSFAHDKRVVRVSGELFFEVNKSSEWPFIIESDNAELMVTGTAFNFRAYADEEETTTTLVEGKVSVKSNSGESMNLSPGFSSIINHQTALIEEQEIDVETATAWKDGRFYYDNQSIRRIMNDLSRWYKIDVFFGNNSIQDKRFSINLPRYKDIEELLTLLEKTEQVKFAIDGNTILVQE